MFTSSSLRIIALSLLTTVCISQQSHAKDSYLFGSDTPSCDDSLVKVLTNDNKYDAKRHEVIVSFEKNADNATIIESSSELYSKNVLACLALNKLGDFSEPFTGEKTIRVRFYLDDLTETDKQALLDEKQISVFADDTFVYKSLSVYVRKLPYFVTPRFPKREQYRRSGKVTLKFMINTSGEASDIKIVDSTSRSFSKSAIRALKQSILFPIHKHSVYNQMGDDMKYRARKTYVFIAPQIEDSEQKESTP